MSRIEVVPVGLGGLFKRAEITIDGHPCVRMRLSKPHQIEVAPGRHVVRARLRAEVSNELAVEVSEPGDVVRIVLDANEKLDFTIGGFPGGRTSMTLRQS